MPRKKGSKSRTGIPIKGLSEAVELIKMAYEKVGDKEMSFNEMATFMNLQKGSSTTVAGALKEYGLIEKGAVGWKISDLGKRCANNEKSALKQAFEKVSIFRDLASQFGDKEVTDGLLVDYLRGRYKKGETNIQLITKRFLEGTIYMNNSSGQIIRVDNEKQPKMDELTILIKLMQLKYALDPPTKPEIAGLVDKLAKELENEEISIRTLGESLKENKNDNNLLKVLVNNLWKILSSKYPSVITKMKEEPPKEGKVEE